MAGSKTREAGVWVDQVAQASGAVHERAAAAARQAWTGFDSWYDVAAVAAMAREISGVSKAGQETVTDLFAEYLAHVTATVRDESRIQVPKVKAQPVRNGVDPVVVHSRPAYVFKETYALTGDDEVAIQRAIDRGMRLIEDDLMLAARQAQQDAMEQLKVARYRRVLRPELSEGGPCGLCVVAANQIYHRKKLLPIHGLCKCITLEITGETGGAGDPGLHLNREDLDKIYAVAGTTGAADLKRTRVTIGEHGELGPVLHVRGQKFTGPNDLGGPVDPEVRERRLDALKGVLANLEQRDRDGEDVDAQLGEQHRIIDRTEKAPTSAGGSGSGSDEPPAAPPGSADDPFDAVPFPGQDLENPDYSRLTQEEKDELAYYASAGSLRLNQALRGQGPMTAELEHSAEVIRAALRKYALPQTYRLTRWTGLDELGVTDYSQIEGLVGGRYVQFGFMSTSRMDYPPAVTFNTSPVVLDLLVPAGTPALRITGELVDPDNVAEREVLVIDARRLLIHGVRYDDQKRRWRVSVIVQGDERP